MPDEERIHDLLWRVVKKLSGDYMSWGTVEREDPEAPGGWWADCSSGCLHYYELADVGEQRISFDWGVCANPKSHRCGLLTFEHQGCPGFEYDEEKGARAEAEFEQIRAEHLERAERQRQDRNGGSSDGDG